jgi:hypothetical protein
VTPHLRQTGRNGILRQTTSGNPPLSLSLQVDFVRSVCPTSRLACVKVAPSFAYNDSLAEVASLVADGTASLLLLSAEYNSGNPQCSFQLPPRATGRYRLPRKGRPLARRTSWRWRL